MMGKRVIQLIGCLHRSGAEKVVVDLTKILIKRKYDVAICSREGGDLIRELNGIPNFIVPKNGRIDVRHLFGLCRTLREQRIDLVHSHLFGNNLYGFLAGLLTKRKIIFTIHGADCFRSRKRINFYRLSAPFVSKIVTVSKPLYRTLTQEMQIREDRVVLIPNGIDTSLFRNAEDIATKRRSLGLPTDALLVGTIGNMKPVKGQDVLINALARVKQSIPRACVVIVGGSSKYHDGFEGYLRNIARETGLVEGVFFLGQREDVEEIVSVLDVFVLPSRSEGTSMALLEAMACGKPIVATRVGGTPDVIRDSETGVLVPPEDPESMAGAISRLLMNPVFARQIGEAARKDVEREFSVESMVEKYVALYEEVLR